MTSFLAVWGAITGTIGLGWNIYVAWRDKGHIELELSTELDHSIRDSKKIIWLYVKAVNHGRRPVTLEKIGARLPDGQDYWPSGFTQDRMGFKVNESEGKSVFIQADLIPANVAFIWMRDTKGKVYKAGKNQLEAVRDKLGKKPEQD